MKKTISLILCMTMMMLGALSESSCASDKSKVETYVDLLNENLPAMSEQGMTFEGAELEGKEIVIKCKLDMSFAEQGISTSYFIAAAKEGANAATIVDAAGTIEKDLLKSVANGGYSMVYRYVDNDGVLAEVEIPNVELKAAL